MPVEAAPTGRLILVGRVAGAFGVKGELRITSYTEDPLALLAYRVLRREDGAAALTLTGGRLAKPNELVARAEEAPDRDAAEALKGLRLFVPRAAFRAPEDPDEFYLADLIGLEARGAGDAPLGRVKAVLNHGAGDILELDPGDGRPTALHAFTREIVPEVRVAEGWLRLVPAIEAGDAEPE